MFDRDYPLDGQLFAVPQCFPIETYIDGYGTPQVRDWCDPRIFKVCMDRPADYINLRLTTRGFVVDLTDERCHSEFDTPWWESVAEPCKCGGSFASGHHNVLAVRRPSREVGQQQWHCSRTGKVWVVQIGSFKEQG